MATVVPFPAPGRPAVSSASPAPDPAAAPPARPSPRRLMPQKTPDQPAWAVHIPWRSLPCDFGFCYAWLGYLPQAVRLSLSRALDFELAAYLLLLSLRQLRWCPEQHLPWCSPRIEVLAARCGCSYDTVKRSIGRLRKAGVLKTTRSLRPKGKGQGSGKWQGVLIYAPGELLLSIARAGLHGKSALAKNSIFSFLRKEKKQIEREGAYKHSTTTPSARGLQSSLSEGGEKNKENGHLANGTQQPITKRERATYPQMSLQEWEAREGHGKGQRLQQDRVEQQDSRADRDAQTGGVGGETEGALAPGGTDGRLHRDREARVEGIRVGGAEDGLRLDGSGGGVLPPQADSCEADAGARGGMQGELRSGEEGRRAGAQAAAGILRERAPDARGAEAQEQHLDERARLAAAKRRVKQDLATALARGL